MKTGRTSTFVALLTMLAIAACGGGMSEDDINDFATRYTAAWNSGDPAAVSLFYSEHGSLQVNDAAPAVGRDAITEVAHGFMSAFPDMKIEMVELRVAEDGAEYHWRFTGTNSGPGGTGNSRSTSAATRHGLSVKTAWCSSRWVTLMPQITNVR